MDPIWGKNSFCIELKIWSRVLAFVHLLRHPQPVRCHSVPWKNDKVLPMNGITVLWPENRLHNLPLLLSPPTPVHGVDLFSHSITTRCVLTLYRRTEMQYADGNSFACKSSAQIGLCIFCFCLVFCFLFFCVAQTASMQFVIYRV